MVVVVEGVPIHSEGPATPPWMGTRCAQPTAPERSWLKFSLERSRLGKPRASRRAPRFLPARTRWCRRSTAISCSLRSGPLCISPRPSTRVRDATAGLGWWGVRPAVGVTAGRVMVAEEEEDEEDEEEEDQHRSAQNTWE